MFYFDLVFNILLNNISDNLQQKHTFNTKKVYFLQSAVKLIDHYSYPYSWVISQLWVEGYQPNMGGSSTNYGWKIINQLRGGGGGRIHHAAMGIGVAISRGWKPFKQGCLNLRITHISQNGFHYRNQCNA